MGATHFTMKTMERVSTEMSLQVLAYNIKRVLKIMGAQPLMERINGYSVNSVLAQYSHLQGFQSDQRSTWATSVGL